MYPYSVRYGIIMIISLRLGVSTSMKVCFETCPLNASGLKVDILSIQDDTDFHTLEAAKNGENYKLSYAPVGNCPTEPTVIIAGKTPGLKTLGRFMGHMRSGLSLEYSAFRSVYSEMKENLFYMLHTQTKLFKLMELEVPHYWRCGDTLSLWNDVFDDYSSSHSCGIQLTQICNCCIHTSNSDEPTRKAYGEILAANPDCLFSSFIISDKLKMIVFLDSPSGDSRFHPEHLFLGTEKAHQLQERNVKITSFPHPSSKSPVVNLIGNPALLKDKYPNAYQAIKRTKKAIEGYISAQNSRTI